MIPKFRNAPTCRTARARPFERSLRRATAVAGGMLMLVWAGIAYAHGPTIKVSHEGLTPPLLNLFVGTTVHFANQASAEAESPPVHVVLETEGRLEASQLVTKGDGWHYTFEEPGTFEVFVKSHPDTKARIVVVPKRRPGAPAP